MDLYKARRNALAVLLGSASVVHAQDNSTEPVTSVALQEDVASAGGQGKTQDKARGTIEEVIVTAQKTTESILDVPISIQAFSADQLDAAGISNTSNLPKITPGMAYTSFAGYSIVYIRGVGTDAFLASDPAVPTYIDGIYYPFNQNLAASLGSVERVEVLKGPQGTLFGRNATGGAISIVTKQPDDKQGFTEISTEFERYNSSRNRALLNVPLDEGLAFMVSGIYNYEPSYYERKNSPLQSDIRPITTRGASAKLSWQPTDDLKTLFGWAYLSNVGELLTAIPITEVKPLGTALGVQEEGDYKSGIDYDTGAATKTRVLEARVEYSSPWFDTRVIGARTEIDSPAGVDFDGSNKPLVNFFAPGQISNLKSVEVQFVSNEESWGADWLNWVGGFLYVETLQGWNPLRFGVAPEVASYIANPPASSLLGMALGGLTSPLFSALETISAASGIPVTDILNDGIHLQGFDQIGTDSYSYFFQATADLGEKFSLTLGGRYQTEDRGLDVATTYLNLSPIDVNQTVLLFDWNNPLLGGPHEASYSNFSPKAVLQYHFDDTNMAYLSYSKGYQGGTFNTVNLYVQPNYVKPVSNTALELGFKGTLLDGSLRLDAAVFQNDLRNVQVQFISLLTGGAVRYETAPKARIRGVEFNATWLPAPESLPDLLIVAGGSYLDGEYTDYPVGSGFDETTGLYFGGTFFPNGGITPGRDFTGNDTVRTPEFSGNLMVSYTFNLDSGSIEISNSLYYNSGFYFQAQNTESSKQKEYILDDVRISYFHNPWNLRVSAYGRNITDTKYHVNKTDIDFGTSTLLAPPLIYGVGLQWSF